MSIYDTGADAFRDTTKWLVAFVPIASIVAVTAAIGPRLAGDAAASESLGDWARANVLPLAGVAAVVAGVVLIVVFGANVLSTQPNDFTSMFTTDQQRLSDAFSAGVGAPFFLDDQAFKLALADLDAKRAAGQPIPDADLTAAVTTSVAIVKA